MPDCPDSFDYELDSYLMGQARAEAECPVCDYCGDPITDDEWVGAEGAFCYHTDCIEAWIKRKAEKKH